MVGPIGAEVDLHGTFEDGFPSVLWTVLRDLGYEARPQYFQHNTIEDAVPRCEVRGAIEPPAHRPDLPRMELHGVGYHYEDASALAALKGLTKFCAQHSNLVVNHPIGLFPPMRGDDPEWFVRFRDAPALLQVMSADASTLWVRCLNAYHRLHQALARATERLAHRTRVAYTRHIERDTRLLQMEVEVTTTRATIQEKNERIAELEANAAQANAREAELQQRLQEAEDELQAAHNMLDAADEQFLMIEQQQAANANNNALAQEEDPEEIEGTSRAWTPRRTLP